ncbi:MAG: hypothetical protein HY096_05830 [Nitrospinae bacterium]|nr:hypothetical protein [Nitrospinota bacterium]
MSTKKKLFKKYSRKGLIITPRDLKLLKELSYGWTTPEELVKFLVEIIKWRSISFTIKPQPLVWNSLHLLCL